MRIPEGERFEAYQEAFLEELKRNRFSLSSQAQTRQTLPKLFSHLRGKGVRDVRAVTEKHLESFAQHLRKSKNPSGNPLSPWTRSAYLSVVRRFFAFLDQRSFVLINPASRLRLPRGRRFSKKPLTQNQVKRLLKAPSPTSTIGQRDRAILEILYGTAIRRNECIRLDVSDVDLQDQVLWVRDGKGKKDRLLPIPSKAAKVVSIYLEEARPHLVHDPKETAFFLTRLGKRMSPCLLEVIVREHGKAAGIPHRVHPHALRHACATHLLKRGADIRHIQELLGHSHITTTATYTKVCIEDLKDVLNKKHPREKLYKGRKSVFFSSLKDRINP